MAEGRKCCVYLPNEKKLELTVQPKLLGHDLMEIVTGHFDLKETDLFGICHRSDSGQVSWIQEEKKIFDHDFIKKSTSIIEFLFAIKFYVDNVISLKHCLTIELYFLHVKSLIYKGDIHVDCKTAFKLAAHVLQITYGDYTDDATALERLRHSPVLPNKVVEDHPVEHCERSVMDYYQELKGNSRGNSILKYMTIVELLPTYGIHYYKVKDKSGLPWWLGLSSKGIFQFDFHNKTNPVKAYHWRQLENLLFREKKFSIEVKERPQRSSDYKNSVTAETRRKSRAEIKVYAWYGTPNLIKSIWLMSIDQHHFYLDNKQSRTHYKDFSSVSQLADRLSNNKNTLFTTSNPTLGMTQTKIKDVNVTVKKGSKEESPEVRAAKRDMGKALKVRRTELEDRLYDKVQELKKICMQEAELIGKYPPEYVRYMDLNEKPPKIKKRVGAEFKLKLRSKDGTSVDRDYPSTVTAASSSSSGFGSEVTDLLDELAPLEQDFETLTQIANAAKKLASDPSAKGRTKTKRWSSYKKTIDKLQEVERKINHLREKCGQEPSTRASMFIPDEDDMMFEEELSLGGKSESEKSSLSEAILLEDDTSLSSGGDVLSTHSTPAILNGNPPHPNSAMLTRKNMAPPNADISEAKVKRSVTPPPSFDRFKGVSRRASKENRQRYPLLPSPAPEITAINPKQQPPSPTTSTRNWISQKWGLPRSKPSQGWAESSLDSIDTVSLTSRQSDDTRSASSNSPSRHKSSAQTRSADSPHKGYSKPMKAFQLSNANTNQNNHNETVKSWKKPAHSFDMSMLKREVSDSALLEAPVQSTTISSTSLPTNKRDEALTKIEESPSPDHSRKRSSSLTDSPSYHLHVPHRKHRSRKKQTKPPTGTDSSKQDAVNRPYLTRMSSHNDVTDDDRPTKITKSRSAQDLQPSIFETNQNIEKHYSNKHPPYLYNTLGKPNTSKETLTRLSQPDLHAVPRDQVYTSHYQPTTVDPIVYSPPPAVASPTYYPAYPYHYYPSHNAGPPHQQTDYGDISQGWVPSLMEYSSRASVCETSSVLSRKEDILRVLEDHIAMKRTPSNASSRYAIKDSRKSKPVTKNDTRKSEQKSHSKSSKSEQDVSNRSQPTSSYEEAANIFQHKPHPAEGAYHHVPKQSRPHPHNYPQFPPYSTLTPFLYGDTNLPWHGHHEDSNVKQQVLFDHYMHHQHGFMHVYPQPGSSGIIYESSHPSQFESGQNEQNVYPNSLAPSYDQTKPQQYYRLVSESSDDNKQINPSLQASGLSHHASASLAEEDGKATHSIPEAAAANATDSAANTVVTQSVKKDTEGRSMAIFKVTKSAPNTPKLKRQKKPNPKPNVSSSDEEMDLNNTPKSSSSQLNPSLLSQQLQKAVSSSQIRSNDSPSKSTSETPSIIIHKPSIKTFDSRTCKTGAKKELPKFNTLSKERLSTPPRLRNALKQKSRKSSDSADFKPDDPFLTSNRSRYPPNHLFSTPSSSQRLRHHSNSDTTPNFQRPESSFSGTLPRTTKSGRKINRIQNSGSKASAGKFETNQTTFKRSQSDTWNEPSTPHMRQSSVDNLSPMQFHEPYQLRNPACYHLYDDQRNYGSTSADRTRLSASAENLLWSESGGTQSGTLV